MAGNTLRPETLALPAGSYRADPATGAVAVPIYQTTSYRFIDTLVFAGVLTQNSLETTVRMAANLGFAPYVAAEATSADDLGDLDGRHWSAAEVQALSLANMNGEYATVTEGVALLGIHG